MSSEATWRVFGVVRNREGLSSKVRMCSKIRVKLVEAGNVKVFVDSEMER